MKWMLVINDKDIALRKVKKVGRMRSRMERLRLIRLLLHSKS